LARYILKIPEVHSYFIAPLRANLGGRYSLQIDTPNTPETMEASPSSGGSLIPSLPVSMGSCRGIIGKQRPLPAPRPTPLKPGSKHETALVRFLDDGLLDISRKYTKKYTPGGYYDIQPMIQDLEKLVDLIWISATREFTTPECSE